MAQKQGGKGKSSSPSDLGYWKRVSAEKQRAKRIERHVNRQIRKLQSNGRKHGGEIASKPNLRAYLTNMAELAGKISYGHKPPRFDPPRMVMSQPVKEIRSEIWPIEQIISEGVLLESSSRESDALACIAMLGTRVSYQHIRQLPSGRRILVSARNGN